MKTIFSAFRCSAVCVDGLQHPARLFGGVGGATMQLAKINDTTVESVLVILKELRLAVARII